MPEVIQKNTNKQLNEIRKLIPDMEMEFKRPKIMRKKNLNMRLSMKTSVLNN